MRAVLTHPAVHFLVAGAAIFVAARWLSVTREGLPEGRQIVIGASQIAQLQARHLARHGAPPTDEETAAVIEAAAVDEMLYREAVARRLDDEDAVVQRRLVQDMRFLAGGDEVDDSLLLRQAHALGLRDGDPVIRRRLIQRMRARLAHDATREAPTSAELVSYFERHRDLFAKPPQVGVSQIFFAGPDANQRATAALEELKATGAGDGAARGRGDPFISGANLPLQSERGLAKVFGPQLASRVLSLPVGEWSGPFPSVFGVHLIWVRERRVGRVAKFDMVRDAVLRRLVAERAEAATRAGIALLKKQYRFDVDWDNG